MLHNRLEKYPVKDKMKAGFEKMGYGYTAIVIFAIIFVILGIVIRLTGIYLTIDHEDLGFFAKLAVLLIVFICLFGYMKDSSSSIYPVEKEIVETYTLKAMGVAQSQNLQGSAIFPFAYVSMETSDYYSVMLQDKDGGYRKNKYPVVNTKIYEVTDNYRVEEIRSMIYKMKDEKKMKWFPPREIQEEAYVIHKSETGKGNYKIYIPEGSIIENYNPM